MLVLSRKAAERVMIGDDVVVTVVRIDGNTVRLGIEAPRSVRVRRGELPPMTESKGYSLALPVTSDLGRSIPAESALTGPVGLGMLSFAIE